MICVDPEGGIIVEFGRTKDFPKGELYEYVFFNDGRIEFTHYVDGNVQSIREWEPPADDLASFNQSFDNAPFASDYSSSFQWIGRSES